jgi:hypothetical protein
VNSPEHLLAFSGFVVVPDDKVNVSALDSRSVLTRSKTNVPQDVKIISPRDHLVNLVNQIVIVGWTVREAPDVRNLLVPKVTIGREKLHGVI